MNSMPPKLRKFLRRTLTTMVDHIFEYFYYLSAYKVDPYLVKYFFNILSKTKVDFIHRNHVGQRYLKVSQIVMYFFLLYEPSPYRTSFVKSRQFAVKKPYFLYSYFSMILFNL